MDRVVLVLGSGAEWEPDALRLIGERPGLVVLKRCVDLDDLLATAASGQAEIALVGDRTPGVDRAAVDQLWEHGIRPVLIAGPGDQARAHAARLGLAGVVASDRLDELPDLLLAEGSGPMTRTATPGPAAPADPTAPATSDGSGDDGAPGSRPGRVIAVWGPAGAPGRTTVATGVAAAVGAAGRPVSLVDADPYAAAVAQGLGILDEASGLLTAARLTSPGALAQGYGTWVRGLGEHLGVVTGLPRPDRWAEVRPGTLEEIVGLLRTRGHVVVDTGFSLEEVPLVDFGTRPGRNELTLAALRAADVVVVVGAADPVGLARLARATVDLAEQVEPAASYVVVNRMRRTLGWSEQEITETLTPFLGATPPRFLPEDRDAVDRALVAGRAVTEAAPDSALGRELTGLAAGLVPWMDAPGTPRGWSAGLDRLGVLRRRRGARAHRR